MFHLYKHININKFELKMGGTEIFSQRDKMSLLQVCFTVSLYFTYMKARAHN